MLTEQTLTLSALICCADKLRLNRLKDAVRQYDKVTTVNSIANTDGLKNALASAHYDFLILSLDSTAKLLPTCLLRYPDLAVLVTVPKRKAGTLNQWLELGATDVISQHHSDRFQHALQRLVGECTLRARLEWLNHQLAEQYELQQILFDTYAEAVMLWQNQHIVECNTCFDQLIGCREQDNFTRTIAWNNWLSPQSKSNLKASLASQTGQITIVSKDEEYYSARLQSLILEKSSALLFRIKPEPMLNSEQTDRDSVTGVLNRGAFIRQLRVLSSESTQQRITVVRLEFPHLTSVDGRQNIDSTVSELMMYRAVAALEPFIKAGALLGRTQRNQLVLAVRDNQSRNRSFAQSIRAQLGSLGGLLEDDRPIELRSLNLKAGTLSSSQVLERLERATAPPVLTKRLAPGKPAPGRKHNRGFCRLSGKTGAACSD